MKKVEKIGKRHSALISKEALHGNSFFFANILDKEHPILNLTPCVLPGRSEKPLVMKVHVKCVILQYNKMKVVGILQQRQWQVCYNFS